MSPRPPVETGGDEAREREDDDAPAPATLREGDDLSVLLLDREDGWPLCANGCGRPALGTSTVCSVNCPLTERQRSADWAEGRCIVSARPPFARAVSEACDGVDEAPVRTLRAGEDPAALLLHRVDGAQLCANGCDRRALGGDAGCSSDCSVTERRAPPDCEIPHAGSLARRSWGPRRRRKLPKHRRALRAQALLGAAVSGFLARDSEQTRAALVDALGRETIVAIERGGPQAWRSVTIAAVATLGVASLRRPPKPRLVHLAAEAPSQAVAFLKAIVASAGSGSVFAPWADMIKRLKGRA